jgi:hypothetical protein
MYFDFVGNSIGCFVLNKSKFYSKKMLKNRVVYNFKKILLGTVVYYQYPKKNNYYAKIKLLWKN